MIILAVVAISASAQTNDLRFSKRVVSGRTYDLSSLSKPSGSAARPASFAAWREISGARVADSVYGWVIEMENGGQITRAILKNPPVAEWNDFREQKRRREALVVELNRLERERKAAVEDFAANGLEAAELQRRIDVAARTSPCKRIDSPKSYERARLPGLKDGFIAAGDRFDSTTSGIDDIRARIKEYDQSAYNLAGEFRVSCYAMETGQRLQGLPVYDRGMILKGAK